MNSKESRKLLALYKAEYKPPWQRERENSEQWQKLTTGLKNRKSAMPFKIELYLKNKIQIHGWVKAFKLINNQTMEIQRGPETAGFETETIKKSDLIKVVFKKRNAI